MLKDTIRLDALSKISLTTRESIRNAQKQGRAPWWEEKEFNPGQHRRYNGYHALCLVLLEMLNKQNIPQKAAADFVRFQSQNVEHFLDDIEKHREAADRFIISMFVAHRDSLFGSHWWPHHLTGNGTAEEIVNMFAGAMASIGKEWKSDDGSKISRVIGGPNVAVQSISEAYHILKVRAEAEGYLVDGRRIIRIADQAEEEAEEA